MKRMWASWLMSLMILPLLACADDTASSSADQPPATRQFVEGTHYERLSQPVRTRNVDKIEVVEIFWYGCPHCFHIEPLINAWVQRKPGDVDFWRSPAMWNDTMRIHARAFYTAEALGILERLHGPLFEAINLQGRPLTDEDKLKQLFVDHGVKAEDFTAAYHSFGVAAQVRQADARARSYQIRGTPELVVDGKYRITARLAGSQAAMLEVVDFLIDRIRAEQPEKAAS